MKRVVMTGPTGAIGMALIQKCIEEGIEVLVICRPDSKRADRIPKHSLVQCRVCDLSELKNFSADVEKRYDVFYHFAWEGTTGAGREDSYLQVKNIEYSLDAVSLASRLGCHTFVGAGSQAEYGRLECDLSETTATNPVTGYGIAKLCAGSLTRNECAKYGIKHVWVRILSVYGPYDNEKSMISFAIKALLNKECPAFTKGEQKWDFLYSGDAANALYLMGEKGKKDAVYVLGSGNAKPLYEYILQLRDAVDGNLDVKLGEIPYAENQIMYLKADISKLKKDVGFVPEVEFSEGIKKTIEWFKGEYGYTDGEKNEN